MTGRLHRNTHSTIIPAAAESQFKVDLGVSVPDDVAVVAHDNIQEGQFSVPRLTTVAQPTEDSAMPPCAIWSAWSSRPSKDVLG
jgi:hypothetical protein